MEDLDPDISHFEFFLARPPLQRHDWADDAALLIARGRVNRCLWGWPSTALLGPDLLPLSIEPAELELLQAVERSPELAIGDLPLENSRSERACRARGLVKQRLLLPVC